jgi:hypothetical protein
VQKSSCACETLEFFSLLSNLLLEVVRGVSSQACEPGSRGPYILPLCLAIVMRNSLKIHCARSISRQRTTPCSATSVITA